MGISVHECEPDVYIECDECENDIDDGAKIYCAKCAGKAPDKDKKEPQCVACRKSFPESEMFSKITGKLCHHCAFVYEAKLAGLIND